MARYDKQVVRADELREGDLIWSDKALYQVKHVELRSGAHPEVVVRWGRSVTFDTLSWSRTPSYQTVDLGWAGGEWPEVTIYRR